MSLNGERGSDGICESSHEKKSHYNTAACVAKVTDVVGGEVGRVGEHLSSFLAGTQLHLMEKTARNTRFI